MSCGPRNEHGEVVMCSWPDRPFRDSVDALIRPGLAAVCIMHSEVEDVLGGLELVRSRWSGPLGAYAHSGGHVHPRWVFENIISPEAYADAANLWKARTGISIIGGCCGLRPDHVSVLKARLGE